MHLAGCPHKLSLRAHYDLSGPELCSLCQIWLLEQSWELSSPKIKFSPQRIPNAAPPISRITNWLTDVTKELGLASVVRVGSFDDESFFTSNFPLTECWASPVRIPARRKNKTRPSCGDSYQRWKSVQWPTIENLSVTNFFPKMFGKNPEEIGTRNQRNYSNWISAIPTSVTPPPPKKKKN